MAKLGRGLLAGHGPFGPICIRPWVKHCKNSTYKNTHVQLWLSVKRSKLVGFDDSNGQLPGHTAASHSWNLAPQQKHSQHEYHLEMLGLFWVHFYALDKDETQILNLWHYTDQNSTDKSCVGYAQRWHLDHREANL